MSLVQLIKELRDCNILFLKEIEAALQLDNAFISKIENEKGYCQENI
ncbi:hypothetical protein MW871_11605 [Flavobacterium sp. I-SCBP12n]|uniref:Uncharacterized protein n=1 Tax=Flavobacterium pygoscelis TaxID=2893176 RepID=A0A9X2BM62_9FLAO|nr:hypothetical protein [Flavobacterium pygoscelis]MCK8142538.1 hypothetical protein [Flavobacterium pygoscelis]